MANRWALAPCVFLILGGLGFACATAGKPSENSRARSEAAADYRRVLEANTRQLQIYQGLKSVLDAQATLQDVAFHQALARHQAALAGRPLPADPIVARGAIEFQIALATSEEKTNDLAADKSFWKLALQWPNGEETPPAAVEMAAEDLAHLWPYYPFLNHWQKVYRVRFPDFRGNAAGPWILHIRGPLGEASAEFASASPAPLSSETNPPGRP